MQPWKAIVLVVPAGMLVGIAAGLSTKPVPLVKEERLWPQSVRENAVQVEPWRPIYESRPQDLSPGSYSYRPDLDYEAFAWPDQEDPSVAMLADNDDEYRPAALWVDAGSAATQGDLPLTRRARIELAATQAERAADEVLGVAAAAAQGVEVVRVGAAAEPKPAVTEEVVVLPAVPAPLAAAGAAGGAPAPSDNGADLD